MDYDIIKSTAFGYADRTDTETTDMYDNFLRIVESKVNRYLKTMESTERAKVNSVDNQVFYGLPADFNGMRNIQITGTVIDGASQTITAKFRTPAQINEYTNTVPYTEAVYYTIIDSQLHIEPQLKNNVIEMAYYRKVPPLTSIVKTNWLGDDHPDAYVFGLLVEINSFNKDPEASTLWEGRFTGVLNEIDSNDRETRWGSGDMLVMSVV